MLPSGYYHELNDECVKCEGILLLLPAIITVVLLVIAILLLYRWSGSKTDTVTARLMSDQAQLALVSLNCECQPRSRTTKFRTTIHVYVHSAHPSATDMQTFSLIASFPGFSLPSVFMNFLLNIGMVFQARVAY